MLGIIDGDRKVWGGKIVELFTIVFGTNLDDKGRTGKRWEGTVKLKVFILLVKYGLEPKEEGTH